MRIDCPPSLHVPGVSLRQLDRFDRDAWFSYLRTPCVRLRVRRGVAVEVGFQVGRAREGQLCDFLPKQRGQAAIFWSCSSRSPLVEKERLVRTQHQVAVHGDPYRQTPPFGQSGLDAEVTPSHFLADLIHRVLRAVAPGDDDAIAALAVLRRGQLGTDARQRGQRRNGKDAIPMPVPARHARPDRCSPGCRVWTGPRGESGLRTAGSCYAVPGNGKQNGMQAWPFS